MGSGDETITYVLACIGHAPFRVSRRVSSRVCVYRYTHLVDLATNFCLLQSSYLIKGARPGDEARKLTDQTVMVDTVGDAIQWNPS